MKSRSGVYFLTHVLTDKTIHVVYVVANSATPICNHIDFLGRKCGSRLVYDGETRLKCPTLKAIDVKDNEHYYNNVSWEKYGI